VDSASEFKVLPAVCSLSTYALMVVRALIKIATYLPSQRIIRLGANTGSDVYKKCTKKGKHRI
jgi:hypothetical protein